MDNLFDSITTNLIVAAISGSVIFIVRALGVDLYPKVLRIINTVRLTIWRSAGQKALLFYTDADDTGLTAQNLVRKLTTSNPKLHFVVLKSGADLLNWPRRPALISAIILLVTDVTPLALEASMANRIDTFLEKYSLAGGTLILGHDAIYRRASTARIQQLAGCRITKFRPEDRNTHYTLNTSNASRLNPNVLSQLPSSMAMNDREIVGGDWASDVETIYSLKSDPSWPLVTIRASASGNVFWCNSGDTNASGPPESFLIPPNEFIALMSSLVTVPPADWWK